MRFRRTYTALVAGSLLVGCAPDLDVTNPNQQSSDTFWANSEDANRGLTATYNSLLLLGTFGRWQAFANDARSDIASARISPWGDLANFSGFVLNDYNFEINRHVFVHNYEMVGRANQVIARVPGIDMDVTERTRIVAEAKFLRGLAYYNLVTLYENIPLITAPPLPSDRLAASPPAATFAQIEKDFLEASEVLPATYGNENAGRATRGAALAMLGKVRLQMAGVLDQPAKWGEAATALAGVVALEPQYSLLPDYMDNFRESRDFNNPESVFEVSTEDQFPVGVTGLSFPKMTGPCYRPGPPIGDYNPTFCDARPTRWYIDQFKASRTATNLADPRLDVTLLYDRPDRAGERVYGRSRGSYFVDNPASQQREDTMIFFRKYGEWEANAEQRWDNPVNYKVVRYADVLLMQAEAMNEAGTGNAATPLNRVRARVGKAPVGALSQAQMRDTILFERMFELGLEASRFNDLRRHDRLTPALVSRDQDFSTFVAGKSERLPIPTTELNRNSGLMQNPGW